MTSQRQIDANRRNAQLSTGPRTPQGKAAVRYNGLSHGITARHAVLEGEDPADFEETIRAFEDDLQPAGPDESVLVHRIADCWWRLRRVRQSETDYFQLRVPLLQKDNKRFRALPPELRPSFIACCDVDGFPTLKNLSLLQTRLDRRSPNKSHRTWLTHDPRSLNRRRRNKHRIEKPKPTSRSLPLHPLPLNPNPRANEEQDLMVKVTGTLDGETIQVESLRIHRRCFGSAKICGSAASTLIATGRSRWVSRALYTTPMPPSPSFDSIR